MKTEYFSPSRTYVMICNRGYNKNKGFFFKKFTLPEEYENISEIAQWYFFNRLDPSNYSTKGIITFEDYSDLHEE